MDFCSTLIPQDQSGNHVVVQRVQQGFMLRYDTLLTRRLWWQQSTLLLAPQLMKINGAQLTSHDALASRKIVVPCCHLSHSLEPRDCEVRAICR